MPGSKIGKESRQSSNLSAVSNAHEIDDTTRSSHQANQRRLSRGRSGSRSLSRRRARSGSVMTINSQALDIDDEEDDDYLAEPASEEIFSGPVSESVPSSFSSFHHRRYSKQQDSSRRDSSVSRTTADDLSSSFGHRFGGVRSTSFGQGSQHAASPFPVADDETPSRRGSIGSIDSESSFSRHRTESFSASSSFRFFSRDEIEQAEGASTAPYDVDPVEYEVLRRVTENEEQDPEEIISDYINATPHQHPSRYSYEESSVLLRHQAEIELARESVELEHDGAIEELDIADESITPPTRHYHRRSSDHYLNRWNSQDSDEPLLSRIQSRLSLEDHSPMKYSSANKQQRFYISEEDMVIFIAGYNSSRWRANLYYLICVCTFGIAYLVLRWIPRWHIACLGTPASLGSM